MRSVIARNYSNIIAGEPLRRFRSRHPDYEDGGQLRDFVYVEDCAPAVLWMLDSEFKPGLYNLGSGCARSWLDLGHAMFKAAGIEENIEFVDMPAELAGRYQYFTEANMAKLQDAGYRLAFRTLEDGVAAYIGDYLSKEDCWA